MSALALSLLLALGPPDPEAPVDPDTPIEITPPQPPPPSIEFPPPSEDSQATGTEPPAEPDEDEEPIEWHVEERRLDDMPYAATAARKSAVRRGNDELVRPFRKPVYSVAAAARLGVLLGSSRQVMQPIAWGLAAQIRLHFVRVVKSRFGLEILAGHTRWQQRDEFEVVVGDVARVTRISLLTHTDVSVGPSFEIPIGPVFLQVGGSGGFAVSSFNRARSADPAQDDRFNEFDGLVRGGLSLGIPIANGQGFAVGTGFHQVFSNRSLPVDPDEPAGRSASPFGPWLESFVAYQVWF